MPTLNPHTFPLVPYPGLAPELALRSGMGSWDAFALDAPSDRLLPFVLSRVRLAGNPQWVACAWIQHADTGQRIETLVPAGAVTPVPSLGLVFTKQLTATTEYFCYDGALIPGLDLPCGVPLRLIVDNAYQSPRFFALAPVATLQQTHLALEWYHNSPLQNVPYGRGYRQRFYINNGALQFVEPRTEQTSRKDPDTGVEEIDSLSEFAQQAFTVAPVPAYLAEALSAARLPKHFLADDEPWRLLSVKTTQSGEGGGRWSATATLESFEPLLRRGCFAPALQTEERDPTFMPRGWRCGDTSDTAADYLPTGAFSCQVSGGQNTGYVLETYRDANPYSPTSGTDTQRLSSAKDFVRCPVPTLFTSREMVLYAIKNDCPPGYAGSREPLVVPDGAYTSAVSQADADGQAQAYAQAHVQANANATGSCSTAGGNYNPTYNANGCFSGNMVNSANPSDIRSATQEEYQRYTTYPNGQLNPPTGTDGKECPSYN